MESETPYSYWSLIALCFSGFLLLNLYMWEKWYLSLGSLIVFAIPSVFIAAFILDQVKTLNFYASVQRKADNWEILVMTTAAVEAMILTMVTRALSRLGASGEEDDDWGASEDVLPRMESVGREEGSMEFIAKKITALREWYSGVTNKQRVILLLVAFVISAIPLFGWLFIAPWLLPLMTYLEYHRP